jgi:exopolysaccharide biosynthesis polyprenyl glycosylphosphotransferase
VSDYKNRVPVMNLLKLLDLALVLVAFGLTTIVIVHTQNRISLGQFLSLRIKVSNFAIFGLALYLCHFVFLICGMYRSRRLSSKSDELRDVLKATTILALCFAAIGAVFSVGMITVQFLALLWVISAGIFCASRLSLRVVLVYIRTHGRNLRYVLIVGTNERAVKFGRAISDSHERGYRLLGFVDDEWAGLANFSRSTFQVVSDFDGLPDYLRRNVVDEVAIFLPVGSFYRHAAQIVSLCGQHGVILRFNSDIFSLGTPRWHTDEFHGDFYITTSPGAGEDWHLAIKRALDILASSSLIVLLTPLMVGVAVAIKLTSEGPIFFPQDRIGINKRRFRIYKFRTMVPDAEKLIASLETRNEVSGPVFKMKNDPRITPIGRFLRRSSIDELPQLLNVLKGDMSLVGPRPLPVRDYEGFNEDWQRRRFSVKPGITCLWQINGRSGISFDQWMLLDLQYMDEWSLWLDFKILAKTVPAVLKGTGAA